MRRIEMMIVPHMTKRSLLRHPIHGIWSQGLVSQTLKGRPQELMLLHWKMLSIKLQEIGRRTDVCNGHIISNVRGKNLRKRTSRRVKETQSNGRRTSLRARDNN